MWAQINPQTSSTTLDTCKTLTVDALSYKTSIYYALLSNAAAHDLMDEGKFVKQNPLAGWKHFDNPLASMSLNEQVPR